MECLLRPLASSLDERQKIKFLFLNESVKNNNTFYEIFTAVILSRDSIKYTSVTNLYTRRQ